MLNKKIIILIIIFSINLLCAENKIVVMVKSSDLDIYSKAVIENKLISYLSQIDLYTVVERTDLPAIITEREFQEFYNNDSLINNFTSADLILICNIYTIENQYSLNLKIETIKTGEIIAAASTFSEPTVTKLINTLPKLIPELLKRQFSKEPFSEKIKLLSIPVRNTNSFLNNDLVKLEPKVTMGAIENIFMINNNSLLTISNPLQLTEYHDYLTNGLPANVVFKYPHWQTTSSALSIINQLFATTLSDGRICSWDINEWGAPYQLHYSDKQPKVITFNYSEPLLYAGFSNGTIDIIDSNTFEIINTHNISNNEIVYINSLDSGLIIVDEFQNVYLYNLDEKTVVATYDNFESQFSSIELSNDKKMLAIGQINGLIKLYNISNIVTTELIDGDWKNPYIRYKWTFELPGKIKSFDFSNSDDIIAVLMENNLINYIDLINKNTYHGNTDSTNNVNNNIIKFMDDYNILLGSNNGEIMIRSIK